MPLTLRTVDAAEPDERRVLVRDDFNVPLDDGRVTDDLRVRASLPTLRHLLERRARVICCSHLGRPKGRRDAKYSLEPVAGVLGDLLGVGVAFVDDVVGDQAARAAQQLEPGQVLLLQNLRFEPGEEANDPDFADRLASLADLYVDDAFGAAHRAHASVVGVAERLPAYAGYLLGNVDTLVIGGGMCFTFLAAQGHEVGDSLFEADQVDAVRDLLARAEREGKRILLPTDVVVADEFAEDAGHRTVPAGGIERGWRGLDIGPDSAKAFADAVRDARTVFWNVPMGVFVLSAFEAATLVVAKTAA